MTTRALGLVVLTGLALLGSALPCAAQPAADPAVPHAHADAAPAAWTWNAEASAFAGYNLQHRKFTDFDAWESQNWLMATLARRAGPWQTTLMAGATAEPFTMRALGSPQAFQTGETYNNAPLIDYQHPHDMVMHLGMELSRTAGAARLDAGAALVGAPPIGPPVFMHRASASENPQVPLSHHQLDATHLSQGVVHAAVTVAGVRVDGGLFRGQEPDERRTDLDTGPLDSQALQIGYARGSWTAQVSTAWLTRPERLSVYDAERRTASVSYTRNDGDRMVAWTLAAGQNREVHGNLEAYLLEGVWRPSRRWAAYARVEWLDKDILDAGYHPVGVAHVHRQSRVGAVTLGGVRDLATGGLGRVGLGADITGYRVPPNLQEPYGAPRSFHVFLRLRGRAGTGAAAHVH
ncbi:MAG: hypothetical protein AB7O28_05695 [Vicinamibacterales bacterium]